MTSTLEVDEVRKLCESIFNCLEAECLKNKYSSSVLVSALATVFAKLAAKLEDDSVRAILLAKVRAAVYGVKEPEEYQMKVGAA